MVISGSLGLGEAVVGDLVSPDEWVVRCGDGDDDGDDDEGDEEGAQVEIISEAIACKEKMVVLRRIRTRRSPSAAVPLGSGGDSVIVDVPRSRRERPCLRESDVTSLARLAKRVEKHYGGAPQDIEWAVNAAGHLRLLQARPVTTIAGSAVAPGSISSSPSSSSSSASCFASGPLGSEGEFDYAMRSGDWLTNCNAGEMFPGAATPLTSSYFGRAIDISLQAMQTDFGVRLVSRVLCLCSPFACVLPDLRYRISPLSLCLSVSLSLPLSSFLPFFLPLLCDFISSGYDAAHPIAVFRSGQFFINMTNLFGAMCSGMLFPDLTKENGEMSLLGRSVIYHPSPPSLLFFSFLFFSFLFFYSILIEICPILYISSGSTTSSGSRSSRPSFPAPTSLASCTTPPATSPPSCWRRFGSRR